MALQMTLANSTEELQQLLTSVDRLVDRSHGMTISTVKSKATVFNGCHCLPTLKALQPGRWQECGAGVYAVRFAYLCLQNCTAVRLGKRAF
jgi:hypothetical protein